MSDSNIGDQLSSPHIYFGTEFSNSLRLEIKIPREGLRARLKRGLLKRLRDSANAVIIGGGGLLDIDYFRDDIAFWSSGTAPKILWGAGHNAHDPEAVAAALPDESSYTQLLPFSAIGLRDWGPGFAWVPCASCMHTAFNGRQKKGSGTLFIIHRDLKKNPAALERILKHAGSESDVVYNDVTGQEIFSKIAAARQVVTSSFHGAYWSTLMQKPVVAIGGGTKIGLLKHAVPLSDPENWPAAMGAAPIYPRALEECRQANTDFKSRVRGSFSTGRGRALPQNPVEERQKDFEALRGAPAIIEPGRAPKIVHFIFGLSPDFGGKPFNIMHYLAVRSVSKQFKPDKIIFHHQYEPDNEFFYRVKDLLTLNHVPNTEYHKGRYIKHFAHRADVIRLKALHEMGGLYLDLDTITVRPLDELLEHSFTIGLQGRRPTQGLCNAVMAAAPGASFVREWLARYDNFDPAGWDTFSVKLPYLMWRSGKYSVNIEAYDRFHWPLWDEQGLKLMFEEGHCFDNALLHHLWESRSYPKYFVEEGFSDAVQRVKAMKTSYGRLARPYL